MESGEWRLIPFAPAGPKIPYRLPELLAAPNDATVFICEGEKDAERIASLGLVATTASAAKWTPELGRWFGLKQAVVVVEDNDGPGFSYASAAAAAMRELRIPNVRRIVFLDLAPGCDVSD